MPVIEGNFTLRRTWRNAGIPSNGSSGTLAGIADPGDLLIDSTNKTLYQNTNTQASPTWTQLGAGSNPGLVGDMAANGTGTANVIGVDSGFSPADHVHKLGTHDHSDNTKGDALVLAALGASFFTADAAGRAKFASEFIDATILGDGAVDDADKFGAGALSANTTGRAVMASDFFNAATAADKFEDSSIPGAKVNFSFGVTPTTIVPDASGAEGSSGSVARADHTHGLTASAPDASYSLAAAAAEGSASTFLRSDAALLARLANNVDFVGRNQADGADVNIWKISANDLFHIATISYEVGTANLTTFTITNPGAPRTITFGDPGGNDSVVYLDTAQTLTQKALTAPDITGGTAIELAALSVRSSGAAFDLLFATTEVLGADRILEFDLADANKKISLTGDFAMSGAFDLTLTITAGTDVTLPTTGTLATLAGSEALTNKTITAMAGNMNMTDQSIEGSTAANGNLTLVATTDGTVTTSYIVASHFLDATADGVATFVKAGAIDNVDFTATPVDGVLGIDTANNRIYYRRGGVFHYVAETAGIQIPKEEVGDMKIGDEVYCVIDKVMSDGAMHALWRKR